MNSTHRRLRKISYKKTVFKKLMNIGRLIYLILVVVVSTNLDGVIRPKIKTFEQ